MAQYQVLDCTLRDGGYYTGWDFDTGLVERYLKCFDDLPVSYVEVGYRSPSQAGYFGEYYYLPLKRLKWIREVLNKNTKLAVMVDEKSCPPDAIDELLEPCRGLVDLVRFTAAPTRIPQTLLLAQRAKAAGFEVALNLMYLSTLDPGNPAFAEIAAAGDTIDYVYLVDSYGAVTPDQLGPLMAWAKDALPQPIGFHGHDNIGLAFANALVAAQHGAEIIDVTVQGMGRGAGNLQTELLVSYMTSKANPPLDLSRLARLSSEFQEMKAEFGWGMSFPYILSGFNNLPQKDVMDWLGMRRFSTPSIVRALQSNGVAGEGLGNVPDFAAQVQGLGVAKGAPVLIMGGGDCGRRAVDSLVEFAERNDVLVIHSSLTRLADFAGAKVRQIVCLAGDEPLRLSEVLPGLTVLPELFVLSADHRGAMPPSELADRLAKVETPMIQGGDAGAVNRMLQGESPANLALTVAQACGPDTIYLAGFDGYADGDRAIGVETQATFEAFKARQPQTQLLSLTPTRYDLPEGSVYGFIA